MARTPDHNSAVNGRSEGRDPRRQRACWRSPEPAAASQARVLAFSRTRGRVTSARAGVLPNPRAGESKESGGYRTPRSVGESRVVTDDDGLETYRAKRTGGATPEPMATTPEPMATTPAAGRGARMFVVHQHDAT